MGITRRNRKCRRSRTVDTNADSFRQDFRTFLNSGGGIGCSLKFVKVGKVDVNSHGLSYDGELLLPVDYPVVIKINAVCAVRYLQHNAQKEFILFRIF
jgi:hypothetical protein